MYCYKRKYNLLFVGEKPVGSSPLLSWAKKLEEIRCNIEFIPDLSKLSTIDFAKKVKKIDAIVFQGYKDISLYEVKQLSVAPIFGIPLIRKWSGSDVLYCTESESDHKIALLLDKVVQNNICVDNPKLIDELNTLGISTERERHFVDINLNANEGISATLPKSVLVYLPTSRHKFYGSELTKKLAENNPYIEFIIVADEEHLLSDLPNIKSLGWVTDMSKVWEKTGCLLRLTEHDGLPRMALEALSRGKYVIYSQPLPGAYYAPDVSTADHFIKKFSLQSKPNKNGIAAMKKMLKKENIQHLLSSLIQAKDKINYFTKIKCLLIFSYLCFKIRLEKLFIDNDAI